MEDTLVALENRFDSDLLRLGHCELIGIVLGRTVKWVCEVVLTSYQYRLPLVTL